MNQISVKAEVNSRKSSTVTLTTLEDLEEFRLKLLEDIKVLLAEKYQKPVRRWIKSHEAMRMLTLAPVTLQRLRNAGIIPFTRVGRTIYYDFNDLEGLLVSNKQNKDFSTNKSKAKPSL